MDTLTLTAATAAAAGALGAAALTRYRRPAAQAVAACERRVGAALTAAGLDRPAAVTDAALYAAATRADDALRPVARLTAAVQRHAESLAARPGPRALPAAPVRRELDGTRRDG